MSACVDIADHGTHSIHPPYGDKWRDMKSLCMGVDNHDANAAWSAGKALSGEIVSEPRDASAWGATESLTIRERVLFEPSLEVLTAGLAGQRSG